ncbi:MAG: hypothetical protein AAF360_03650, partial [Pseudomonadota bacterium]
MIGTRPVRWIAWMLVCGALAIGASFAAIETAARLRPAVDMSRLTNLSPALLGAGGERVDAFLSPDQKWRFALGVDEAPVFYRDLLICYEDR